MQERSFAVVYVIVVVVVVVVLVAIQGRSLFGAHQRETKDPKFHHPPPLIRARGPLVGYHR